MQTRQGETEPRRGTHQEDRAARIIIATGSSALVTFLVTLLITTSVLDACTASIAGASLIAAWLLSPALISVALSWPRISFGAYFLYAYAALLGLAAVTTLRSDAIYEANRTCEVVGWPFVPVGAALLAIYIAALPVALLRRRAAHD